MYYDLLLEQIDSESVAILSKIKEYTEFGEEKKKLAAHYPCIDMFFDREEEKITLSTEEHKALIEYIELARRQETLESREYYWAGHRHARIYENRLGIHSQQCGQNYCNKGNRMEILGWNHKECPEWLGSFVQRLDDKIEAQLKRNPHYCDLLKEEEQLLDKYPVILQLVEMMNPSKELKLSIEEQKALSEFYDIKLKRNTYEELASYLIGQEDIFSYLYTIYG